MYGLVLVGLTVLALLAFTKGEFNVGGRKIDHSASHALGWIWVGGVVLTVLFGSRFGSAVGLGILIVTAVFGVMLSSKPVPDR